MDTLLEGRTAIVCGASSGLGYACARALAGEGVAVTIVARRADLLEAAARSIDEQTGAKVTWIVGDVIETGVREAAIHACPTPDILVNNAGGPPPGDHLEWTREDWLRALDANMLSAIEFMRIVLPGMAQRGFGRIVNISSGAIKAPLPMLGLSTAARLGLAGYVASIARDYVRRNVTINNLLPGPFETVRLRKTIEAAAQKAGISYEDMRDYRLNAHPAGRFGRPEEFAAACVYLCSGHAGYVTAQNILLDGGQYPGVF